MNNNKTATVFYVSASVVAIGIIGYFFMGYILPILLPFLIAALVGATVQRPSEYLWKRTRVPMKVWCFTLTLAVISALLTLLGFGVYRLSLEVWHFLGKLGETAPEQSLGGGILGKDGVLGSLLTGFGEEVAEGIYQLLIKLLGSLGGFLSGILASVPKVALGSLVTVIASVYLAMDYKRIKLTMRSLIPTALSRRIGEVSAGARTVLIKYLRSYLLLMLITLGITLAGLLILRVPYAVLLSLGISLLDVLPVIGVGTVLIPWSVVELIKGNVALSVGLLVLYGANLVVRQAVEPRIVGKQLGVHPVLTLFLLYVGYSLFGIAGLLLVPLATVVIKMIEKKYSPKVDEPPVSQ